MQPTEAAFSSFGPDLTLVMRILVVCLAWAPILMVSNLAQTAEWKPAVGPLKTRWADGVDPASPHAEYPRPQIVRADWLSLNGVWEFAAAKKEEIPPVGKSLAERVLVPFPIESALSGVMRRENRVWYRREFDIPKDWSDRRVLLHFGAVDWESVVYLNGNRLGTHQGGYDGFSFDLTDSIKAQGPQELIVGVFDPSSSGTQPRGKQVDNPEGIYYTPSTGIWQSVWLEPVSRRAAITGLRITPRIDELEIQVDATGEAAKVAEIAIAAEGKEVARQLVPVGKIARIPIADGHVWTPDDPFLYDLQVVLPLGGDKGAKADSVTSYFGLRSIELAKDAQGVPRLLLNGRAEFQVGPLDQGFWPDGLYTAPSDEALRYDLEVTKQLGFNMVRKHVKVEPERWYYWCDKLGLLVWQDMPSGDASVAPGRGEIKRSPESAAQFERELRRMVEGRGNHPCVVMWVVFNEGWGQFETVRLTELTKSLDPSRLVNCASGWNDMPAGDVIDLHSYPGPAAPEPDGKRALVLGEFGGLGLGVDGHTWSNRTWGYRGTASSRELTWRYLSLLRGAWSMKDSAALNAAVYTQTTDVETEANGLLTYDREILKVDVEKVAAANQGRFPKYREILPTSVAEGQSWRYVLSQPENGWEALEFDDASWKTGPGGFGTVGTPSAMVRTRWDSSDIWLRREFTLSKETAPADQGTDVLFSFHHDEDAEIYINGELATQATGYSIRYDETPLSDAGRAALKIGKNVIAVHCKQTGGGQYIDVGILEATVP